MRENSENTVHFQSMAVKYRQLIGESTRAADPMVLALAIYLKNCAVLTDDDGLSAACFAEGIASIRLGAFRKLEGLS
jgi:rRNA-processing protein FCF1